MSFKQSFRDVPENGSEMGGRDAVPAGEYWVVVEKAIETETKVKKLPMIKMKMRITNSGPGYNMAIWDNIVFCEDMSGRNKHLLKVLGQPYNDDDIDIEAKDWEGTEMRIKVKIGSYNGKPKSEVSQYLSRETEEEKKKPTSEPENKKDTGKKESDEEEINEDSEIPF